MSRRCLRRRQPRRDLACREGTGLQVIRLRGRALDRGASSRTSTSLGENGAWSARELLPARDEQLDEYFGSSLQLTVHAQEGVAFTVTAAELVKRLVALLTHQQLLDVGGARRRWC